METRLTLAVVFRVLPMRRLPLTMLSFMFLLIRQQVRQLPARNVGLNRQRVSVLVWVLRLTKMGIWNVAENLPTKPTPC